MAFTAMITWVAQNLTAALLNQQLRDNMNETAPGIASGAGNFIVTDGANSIVERNPDTAAVATSEGTTSTTFTDLATAGPAVTATTGTEAFVILSARLVNSDASHVTFMGFAVSGATTLAADVDTALQVKAGVSMAGSRVILVTGLTAGSNVFTAKYRTSNVAGTASAQGRDIAVIPL